MESIVLFGKGGIGKSTISSSITALPAGLAVNVKDPAGARAEVV